jgi:hypothetical protein
MQGRPDSEMHDRKGYLPPSAVVGERGAVEPESGKSVRQSDPGLRRPTPPSTAGRKSAARPLIHFPPATNSRVIPKARETERTQPKTGRSARRSLATQPRRAAPGSFTGSAESTSAHPYALDDSHITNLIQFFEILDRWDREAHGPQAM